MTATLFPVAPACADVIEIGDGGAVLVRSGGGDVHWTQTGGGTTAGDGAESPPEVARAAITEIGQPQVPEAWATALTRSAQASGVSPDLLAALVWQESRWRPTATSGKGALGLAQLMPATARALSIDPRNPAANLDGGARYLRQMLDMFDGNVERALAAYNAGPGRVRAAGGIPAIRETRAYVSTILDRLTTASVATAANIDTGVLQTGYSQ